MVWLTSGCRVKMPQRTGAWDDSLEPSKISGFQCGLIIAEPCRLKKRAQVENVRQRC